MSQPARLTPASLRRKTDRKRPIRNSYLPAGTWGVGREEGGDFGVGKGTLDMRQRIAGDPQGGTNPNLLNGNLQKSPSWAIKTPLFRGLICY